MTFRCSQQGPTPTRANKYVTYHFRKVVVIGRKCISAVFASVFYNI